MSNRNKQKTMKKVIINKNSNFGTIDGVIMCYFELKKIVNASLKQGKAKKIVDNYETLMYELF